MNSSAMFRMDVSLANAALYQGCEIVDVAGRPTLVTKVEEAIVCVGRNIRSLLEQIPPEQRRLGVVLLGPMAIWAYLIVFHAVLHTFSKVYYDDGRNVPVLVAQH